MWYRQKPTINALSYIAVTVSNESMFVPTLLLPSLSSGTANLPRSSSQERDRSMTS